MALLIKNSMNGLSAIAKIGIAQTLFDWLKASDVDVKLTATEFKFIPPAGETLCVPVTLLQLQALNGGTLPAHQKSSLGMNLTAVVKSLMSIPGDLVEEEKFHQVAGSMTGTLNKLPPLAPVAAAPSTPAPQIEAGKWPAFPPEQMYKAPAVKLRDAVKMYQPVNGSSHGSRYFMIAASADVRVGVRLNGGTMSVRIEGPAWEKHAASITACGFDTIDKGKGYASVHLSVGPDPVMANKTLGAVLMGLGIPLETPLPNLQLLKH